ncbi:MAG: SpoIIE family protein phosphatase [Bacteroidia bacterium]
MLEKINKSLSDIAYRNFYYVSFIAFSLWIIYIGFDYLFAHDLWLFFLPIRFIGFTSSFLVWCLTKNRKMNVYIGQDIVFYYMIFSLTILMSTINLSSLSLYYTGYGMVLVLSYISFVLSFKRILYYASSVLLSFILIFYFSSLPIYTHLGLGIFTVFSELIMICFVSYVINNNHTNQIKAQLLLKESHQILEHKQKEILDSIHYAKRIQNALLANKTLVNKNIPENFILFNPKDIVSGDFYWAAEHQNKFYLAVCDCTGHGVPGAFMSLLNIGFLSEAIKEKNIEQPGDIFNYVRTRLIEAVNNEGQKDGMDGILVCYNKTTKEISYSAANNEPILVANNEISILEKDRMPVGIGERKKDFTTYKINAQDGDILYLYTDGYADQFGGPKGKKFKYKQLNDLLLEISAKSMNEQKEILTTTFSQWKGNLEQVDDVLLIGMII